MKTIQYYLMVALAIAGVVIPLNTHAQTNAQSSAQSSSSESNSVKKTVTVTSKNGVTTKVTTIIRNGKKQVITEVTGADGKTHTTREGGNDDPQDDDNKDNPDPNNEGPWLGVRVKELNHNMRSQLKLKADEGVVVDLVAKDSPATTADIRVGDIILSLAEISVSTPAELQEEINRHEVGDTFKLAYLRGGERKTIDVTFAERPADQKNDRPKNEQDKGKMKAFQDILNDPKVPEDLKKKIRDMMKNMKSKKSGAHSEEFSFSTSAKDFNEILNEPKVPEEFKRMVQETMNKIKDLENKK